MVSRLLASFEMVVMLVLSFDESVLEILERAPEMVGFGFMTFRWSFLERLSEVVGVLTDHIAGRRHCGVLR